MEHVVSEGDLARDTTKLKEPPPRRPSTGGFGCINTEREAPWVQRARVLELKRLADERRELEAQLAEVKRLMRSAVSRKSCWAVAKEAATDFSNVVDVDQTKIARRSRNRKKRRRTAASVERKHGGDCPRAKGTHIQQSRDVSHRHNPGREGLNNRSVVRISDAPPINTSHPERSCERGGFETPSGGGQRLARTAWVEKRHQTARAKSMPTRSKRNRSLPGVQVESQSRSPLRGDSKPVVKVTPKPKSVPHLPSAKNIDRSVYKLNSKGTRSKHLRGRPRNGKESKGGNRTRPSSAFRVRRHRAYRTISGPSVSPASSLERRRRKKVQDSVAEAILVGMSTEDEESLPRQQDRKDRSESRSRRRNLNRRRPQGMILPKQNSSTTVKEDSDEIKSVRASYWSDFEFWEEEGSLQRAPAVDDQGVDNRVLESNGRDITRKEVASGGTVPSVGSRDSRDQPLDSNSTWDLHTEHDPSDGEEDSRITDRSGSPRVNQRLEGKQMNMSTFSAESGTTRADAGNGSLSLSYDEYTGFSKNLSKSTSEYGSSLYDLVLSSHGSNSNSVELRAPEAQERAVYVSHPPSERKRRPQSARAGIFSTSRVDGNTSSAVSSEQGSSLLDIPLSSSNNSIADAVRGHKIRGGSTASSRLSWRSIGSGIAVVKSSSDFPPSQPRETPRTIVKVGSNGHEAKLVLSSRSSKAQVAAPAEESPVVADDTSEHGSTRNDAVEQNELENRKSLGNMFDGESSNEAHIRELSALEDLSVDRLSGHQLSIDQWPAETLSAERLAPDEELVIGASPRMNGSVLHPGSFEGTPTYETESFEKESLATEYRGEPFETEDENEDEHNFVHVNSCDEVLFDENQLNNGSLTAESFDEIRSAAEEFVGQRPLWGGLADGRPQEEQATLHDKRSIGEPPADKGSFDDLSPRKTLSEDNAQQRDQSQGEYPYDKASEEDGSWTKRHEIDHQDVGEMNSVNVNFCDETYFDENQPDHSSLTAGSLDDFRSVAEEFVGQMTLGGESTDGQPLQEQLTLRVEHSIDELLAEKGSFDDLSPGERDSGDNELRSDELDREYPHDNASQEEEFSTKRHEIDHEGVGEINSFNANSCHEILLDENQPDHSSFTAESLDKIWSVTEEFVGQMPLLGELSDDQALEKQSTLHDELSIDEPSADKEKFDELSLDRKRSRDNEGELQGEHPCNNASKVNNSSAKQHEVDQGRVAEKDSTDASSCDELHLDENQLDRGSLTAESLDEIRSVAEEFVGKIPHWEESIEGPTVAKRSTFPDDPLIDEPLADKQSFDELSLDKRDSDDNALQGYELQDEIPRDNASKEDNEPSVDDVYVDDSDSMWGSLLDGPSGNEEQRSDDILYYELSGDETEVLDRNSSDHHSLVQDKYTAKIDSEPVE